MAGSIRNALAALVLGLVLTSSASALGGGFGFRAMSMAPCPPPPVWCCYVPAPPPCWAYPAKPFMPPASQPPTSMPKVNSLAEPLSVPAPKTAEPPLATQRAPTIAESRSYGTVTKSQATDLPPGSCRVGFWNITGADVTVTIDGQARSIPKDRSLTFVLERSFVWQISGRAPHTERVPDGQNNFEVIVRP